MAAVIAFAPKQSARPLPDAEIVRLARAVLADPRCWTLARADLDPAQMRAAQARASALLQDALDTV
ncbi:MAG: hypothetical protein KJS97_13280 [Alphaproteobacteria bacterium]|nr:hypothetical protein [Alphaproteobacteria bacterium]